MKLPGDNDVRYFAYVDETVAGPYSVEGLESLVYLKKITPDTLIVREGADAYTPIKDSDLAPVLFPGLWYEAGTSPDAWTPPGQENDPAQINRKRYRTGTAEFENVNAQAGHLPKIDVYDILGEIRETEKLSGFDLPQESRFRVSKRGIDFWIMVIVGNTVILGSAVLMQNTTSMVFGIAGSGLFTFGLLWSMYGVMDRY